MTKQAEDFLKDVMAEANDKKLSKAETDKVTVILGQVNGNIGVMSSCEMVADVVDQGITLLRYAYESNDSIKENIGFGEFVMEVLASKAVEGL